MPILVDLDHVWGEDLAVGPSGDLRGVTGAQRTTLRVIRRLLTRASDASGVAPDYGWHPNYGAGLGRRIGQQLDIRGLQAVVFSQLLLEASVSRIPLPTVTVSPFPANNGASITASYVDKTGTTQNFSFNLTNT